MLGGAIGFQFLLGDAMSRKVRLPKAVPWDLTIPNFNVRFEIEAVGARNYDLSTDGFTASVPYHAELSELSLMVNSWLDLPLRPAVTAAFGRQPSFDPMSVYFGAGLGYSRAELSVTDNLVAGEGVSDNFAWQIGVGVGYDLTERFTISAGYRYLDPGITEAQLLDPVGNDSGDYSLDLQSHEAVVSLRVSFYSVGWPRRSTRGLDW